VIDTHCHLTFPELTTDLEGVVSRAAAQGVGGMITVSTTTENCEAGLRVAEAHPNVWCSSGVHPLYAAEGLERGGHDWEAMRRVAGHERCVAWGELGLDRHYDEPPLDLQRRVLTDQLALIERADADGLALPIIVHCRKAVNELLPILRCSAIEPERFVFHCFTEPPEQARRVLDFGAMLSFTGVVTYANAAEVAESASLLPPDRIMAETDAPFLSPQPVRKQRPCEPAFAVHTARRLAELRGVAWPEFEATLDDNTERFFGVRVPAGAAAGNGGRA